jgi:hypothetical protein
VDRPSVHGRNGKAKLSSTSDRSARAGFGNLWQNFCRRFVMPTTDSTADSPRRDSHHEVLNVFLGDWKAEGTSFGGANQTPQSPRGNSTPWTSTHTARWHSGQFFLIQDERAQSRGPFDTLSVMGWDPTAGRYFARTFENHGFYRHYDVTVAGQVWTLDGDTERARIEFELGGTRQNITWEWRPNDVWLPLCDRIATKV